jgi:hypothetical protein
VCLAAVLLPGVVIGSKSLRNGCAVVHLKSGLGRLRAIYESLGSHGLAVLRFLLIARCEEPRVLRLACHHVVLGENARVIWVEGIRDGGHS